MNYELCLLLQVATDRDESGDPIDHQQLTLQSLAEEQLFAKALASEAADGGGALWGLKHLNPLASARCCVSFVCSISGSHILYI